MYSTGTGGQLHTLVANMAAARSSKEQWAGFLRRLVQDGETAKITPRSAFAALQQKFDDVPESERQWVKEYVRQLGTLQKCTSYRY